MNRGKYWQSNSSSDEIIKKSRGENDERERIGQNL
jgi:hypothetical protein